MTDFLLDKGDYVIMRDALEKFCTMMAVVIQTSSYFFESFESGVFREDDVIAKKMRKLINELSRTIEWIERDERDKA